MVDVHEGNLGLFLGWPHLILGIVCILSRNVDALLIGLYGVIVGIILLMDHYHKKELSRENDRKRLELYDHDVELNPNDDTPYIFRDDYEKGNSIKSAQEATNTKNL